MLRLKMIVCALLCVLTSCFGLFDNGSDSIVDDYATVWIDFDAHRTLCLGNGVIVPAYVFAVGYDNEYLFVKQHPIVREHNEKVRESITNYYLIERTQNESQNAPVYGPLSEEKFNALCNKLGIKEVSFSTHYPENI